MNEFIQSHQMPPLSSSEELFDEDTLSSETRLEVPVQPEADTTSEQESLYRRVGKWAVDHSFHLGLGLAAAGAVYAGVTTPYQEILDSMKEQGPEVAIATVSGIVASEAAFIGGIGLAMSGLGLKKGAKERDESKSAINLIKDTVHNASNSNNWNFKRIKAGTNLNLIGALGTPAVATVGAVAYLESAPASAVAVGAAVDIGATLVSRAGIIKGINMRKAEYDATHEQEPKLITKPATQEDLEGIVDLDIKMFDSAYGEKRPAREDIAEMMRQRLENIAAGGGWMFIQKKGDTVVASISAFRTNKPAEDFTSWEDSTNNGTLNGRIEPNGRHAYIANLTVDALGNRDIITGALFAEGIHDGVEDAYFESRMPGFRRWVENQIPDQNVDVLDDETLADYAQTYRALENNDNKPYDWQLRMYQSVGAELGEAKAGLFEDEASLGYGVLCKFNVPLSGAPRVFRAITSSAVRFALRYPKLMEKVL